MKIKDFRPYNNMTTNISNYDFNLSRLDYAIKMKVVGYTPPTFNFDILNELMSATESMNMNLKSSYDKYVYTIAYEGMFDAISNMIRTFINKIKNVAYRFQKFFRASNVGRTFTEIIEEAYNRIKGRIHEIDDTTFKNYVVKQGFKKPFWFTAINAGVQLFNTIITNNTIENLVFNSAVSTGVDITAMQNLANIVKDIGFVYNPQKYTITGSSFSTKEYKNVTIGSLGFSVNDIDVVYKEMTKQLKIIDSNYKMYRNFENYADRLNAEYNTIKNNTQISSDEKQQALQENNARWYTLMTLHNFVEVALAIFDILAGDGLELLDKAEDALNIL